MRKELFHGNWLYFQKYSCAFGLALFPGYRNEATFSLLMSICHPFTVRIHLFPYRAATLAVPPVVENAEVSVVVSADSRRATATYRCTGIYTISGSQTLTFDCNAVLHVWNPALTLCTGTYTNVEHVL